jgi:hypothetical protein
VYLELINSTLSKRKLWVSWLILLGIICLIHSLTLTISPPLWVDEAQIIEHGRLIPFEPHSDWSMNWWSTEDRPILLWSYLGPALQELSFRVTMPLPTGPRLASLLGATIAATASVGWLLSMKTYRPVALILGVVFLLDPMFVQSYRGGRVDCWALACCFGSCWMVRYAMSQMIKRRPFRRMLAAAGGIASVAFFAWPSAVLTYPLVLAELSVFLLQEHGLGESYTNVARSLMAFVTGALTMTLLLLIPLWHLLKVVLNDVPSILSASQSPYDLWLQLNLFLDSLKYSQLLPISALIGFICGRGRLIVWVALFTFVYILGTRVYPGRLVYLLPYAVGLIGVACQSPLMFNTKTCRVITRVGLSILLIASVSLSLIIRPALALSQKVEREPSFLFSMGSQSVGEGPHKIYLGAWEFYFVGRNLGWHMFHEYVDQDQMSLSNIFSRVDYAIFHSGDVNDDLATALSKAGLHFQKALTRDGQPHADIKQQLNLVAKSYGPYLLYSRKIVSDGI